MFYRREIDGLRALAVLPVILYHAGFSTFSGGYVGVDIFFVISGYLITGILLKELAEGRFSILKFYERRARRILPALFAMILVSIPLAALLMTPLPFQNFAQSIVAVALFASNLFFYIEQADYFRQEAELLPLLHTWSLAVEEQFYIVFPVLLAVLWRFGQSLILWVLIACALASFALAEWASHNWVIANFYLSPSRAWELLAGSFCAFALQSRRPAGNEVFSMAGLLLVTIPVFAYDASTPFPGVYAIAPVLGTSLIILFASQDTITGWLLSFRSVVLIGLISYSAYLWHQPVFVFARLYVGDDLHGFEMVPLIIVSLVIAYGSWRYIEQPFRQSRDKPSPVLPTQKGVFAVSITGLAALCGFGLYGHVRDGLPNRFDPPEFVAAGQFALPQVSNGYCFYSIFTDDNLEVGEDGLECRLGETEAYERQILLFGDSYAGHWEPFWDKVGVEQGINIHSVTSNWCGPSLNDDAFPRAGIGNEYHAQCLINRAFLAENIQNYDLIVYGGEWDQIENYGYMNDVFELLEYTLASSDAEVILMTTPIKFTPQSVERAIYFSDGSRLAERAEHEAQLARLHEAFHTFATKHDRLHFWDREVIFGDDPTMSSDGLPYSLDGGHVSIYGSLQAAETFMSREKSIPVLTN